MSGVYESAEDNGVVVTVLGMVLGLAIAGAAAYPYVAGDAGQDILLVAGFGGVIVLMSGFSFYNRLSDVPTNDPVEIVRKDLNDRDVILRGVVKLVLGWVLLGVVWEFLLAAPPRDFPGVVELATTRPLAVVGWVLLNVFLVLSVMFRSWRERGLGETRSYRRQQ